MCVIYVTHAYETDSTLSLCFLINVCFSQKLLVLSVIFLSGFIPFCHTKVLFVSLVSTV